MNGLLAEAGDQPTLGDGISMGWMGHSVPSRSMPGLATKADYDRLAGEQGLTADANFSKLMIAHHEAGAEMAEYAARNGSNDAVRELARKMAKTQRFEIKEMNLRRQTLGLPVVHPSTLIPGTADPAGHPRVSARVQQSSGRDPVMQLCMLRCTNA